MINKCIFALNYGSTLFYRIYIAKLKKTIKIIFFLMLMIVLCIHCRVCADTTESSHTYSKTTFQYNSYPSISNYQMSKVFQENSSPFYTYYIGTFYESDYLSDVVTMTKYDSNDNIFASNMILGTPVMNSMTFNVGLQKLYYLMKTNTLKLVVIDTFNLIFYNAYSYNNLACDLSYCSITLDLVNSQIIFSTYIVGSNKIGVICEIDQGALNINIHQTTSIDLEVARSIIKFESNEIFFVTISISSMDLLIYRYMIDTLSIKWANIIRCSNPLCSLGFVQSLTNADQSIVYTLISYGATPLAYLFTINAELGTAYNTQFVSNTLQPTDVYSMFLVGNTIYMILECSYSYIVIYSTTSFTFSYFKFGDSSITIYGACYDSYADRMIFAGTSGINIAYSSRSPIQGLYIHPDIETAIDFEITAITSSEYSVTDYPYISMTSDFCSSDNAASLGSTYSVQTLVLNTNSQISYIFQSISLSGVSESENSYNIQSSCLINSAYSTETSMLMGDNTPLVSWINYTSSTDTVSWKPPQVSTSTTYSLQYLIKDPDTLELASTPVTLVITPSASSASSSSSSSTSAQSSTSNSPSNDYSKLETTPYIGVSLSSCLISTGIAASLSIFNISSMSVLWMVFGQMRLYQLLLLQSGFVHQQVIDYIKGFKFTLFSFQFLDIKEFLSKYLTVFRNIVNYLDYKQENSKLDEIGIESGSTFVNNIDLYTTIILTLITHILILIIFIIISKCCANSLTRLQNFIRKTHEKFTFGAHIRIIIESSQFVLLSSISEVYQLNVNSQSMIISFCIAVLHILIIFLFLLFVFVVCTKLKRNSDSELLTLINHPKLYKRIEELFEGTNNSHLAKGFTLIANIRIILFVLCIVCMKNNQIYAIVGIQILYLIVIIIARPFDKVHINLILINNEIFFFVMSSILVFLNSEKRWDYAFGFASSSFGLLRTEYIILLSLNSVITMMILVVVTIVKVCKKLFCKQRVNENITQDCSSQNRKIKWFKCFQRKSAFNNIKVNPENQVEILPIEESKVSYSLNEPSSVQSRINILNQGRAYNVSYENSVNLIFNSQKQKVPHNQNKAKKQ